MSLPGWVGRPQVHAAGCLLSLMALLAVLAFTIGTLEYTKTRGKLLLTALLVAGYFVTLLAATPIPRAGAGQWLRTAAVTLASVALLLMVLGLWGAPDSSAFWKATAIVTVLAMGVVAAGVSLPGERPGRMGLALGMPTAGLAGVLALMGIVGIAVEIKAPVYWWIFGLLALGWVAAGVLLTGFRLRGRRNGG